ncbi:MAG: hypothetical protein WDZ35_13095, partial [Crocinitomicaceae bacterium]
MITTLFAMLCFVFIGSAAIADSLTLTDPDRATAGSECQESVRDAAKIALIYPEKEYACGSNALPGSSQNMVPLKSLMPGDFVQVGQFEMQVTGADAQPTAGRFTGYGKIKIPFMFGLSMNVSFTNIYVDENMLVRDGRVEAISEGVDQWALDQQAVFVNGTISDVQFSEEDSIVTVYLENGESLTFDWPTNGPLILEDENGRKFIINPDDQEYYASVIADAAAIALS